MLTRRADRNDTKVKMATKSYKIHRWIVVVLLCIAATIYKGRVLLAIEKYKNGEASLGKAADLAGLCIGDMMTTLEQYGVKSNLEVQDYLEGLDNLKKVW